MIPPVLQDVALALLQTAIDIMRGASSKEIALSALETAASTLRDDLRAEAAARVDAIADAAEAAKFPGGEG